MIQNRRALYRHLFPHHGVGAEIGVYRGRNAEYLLKDAKPHKLYLVDSWRQLPGSPNRPNHDQATLRRVYRRVKQRFARYARVHILPVLSIRAARLFDPDSFDWVYIDAAHDDASVTLDLAAWWPLVRPGGWLAGHDYLDDPPVYGVKSAVDRFAADRTLEVGVTGESSFPSWYLQKPARG